jgi:predicted RNase H-like HicB family nuclease
MLTIVVEREDGRWIGEVAALPGAMACGTEAEARLKAAALAPRVIADRTERGEPVPEEVRALFAPASWMDPQQGRMWPLRARSWIG